jgi:peptidoglycan hydrolase-like protein with peptidoglycan-binding domain
MFKRIAVLIMALAIVITVVFGIIHRPGSALAAAKLSSMETAAGGYANNDCPPGQSLNGSTNDANWVRVIQYRLDYAYFALSFPYFNTHPFLSIDGSYGQQTYDAVVAYQSFEAISGGSGAVGNRTWASLGFCQSTVANAFHSFEYSAASDPTCPAGQSMNASGNTSEFVAALQDLLNQEYFNHPSAYSTTSPKSWDPYLNSDGSFGSQTFGAVYDYQYSNRVDNGGGAVGNRTWAMLGMCAYLSVG